MALWVIIAGDPPLTWKRVEGPRFQKRMEGEVAWVCCVGGMEALPANSAVPHTCILPLAGGAAWEGRAMAALPTPV